jgi:NhaA family Na+:H+ antiporter
MAVAVVDDLTAIVIIAFFYTSQLSMTALLIGLGGLVVLFVVNRLGCRNLAVYFWIGLIVWVCVLKSGVHATLAGVAVGLAIPLSVKNKDGAHESFGPHVEHMLHPWVAFIIMPLFAFANAGVSFAGVSADSMVASTRLGIMLGLIVGKPVGILAGAFLVVKLGLARLPLGITWSRLFGVGLLAGIGFTMSLFIGTLAFEGAGPGYAVSVRLGVLGGSIIAAVLGYLWLRFTLRPEPGESGEQEA